LIEPQVLDHTTVVLALPITVAVNCSVEFTLMEPDAGLIVINTVGGGASPTVTFAEAKSVVSAKLVAVTVQEDALAGAVYSPVEMMDPQVADHITAVFVLPVTVAVNCSVVSTLMESDSGLMVIPALGGGGGGPVVPALKAIAKAWMVDELST